jgi:hypothetical protein
MMLRFRWDSLRRDDHILVHDVAVSDTDEPDAGRVVRPGRFTSHADPRTGTADCWRCAEALAA